MILIATVPLLVSLIGAAIYLACANAKVAEVGRLMFACGLLTALLVANHTVRLG